jgi:hypothetical protein
MHTRTRPTTVSRIIKTYIRFSQARKQKMKLVNKILRCLAYAFVAQTLFAHLSLAHAALTRESARTVSDQKGDKVQVVQISGMRDQDWKPYRTLIRGLDAFTRHRALAPETRLKFILRPQIANVKLDQLALKIVGDNAVFPVALNRDGTFELPRHQAAVDDNADMVLNQKQDVVRWNLVAIRSPELAPHQRRIGDLRLTCEVFAAMEDWAVLKRQYGLRGVPEGELCTSPRLNWTFFEAQRIRSARLYSESRVENLSISTDKRGFIVNLFDVAWLNNAVIDLDFYDDE